MRSSLNSQFTDLCYGVPVALIGQWLSVSTSVATKYKHGRRAPSPAAVELFKLKLEGRVVPDEWEGFCFRGGKLWDTNGKAFGHGHLRAYELAMQLLRAFSRDELKRTGRVDGIFSTAGLNQLGRTPISRPQIASDSKVGVHTPPRVTGPIGRGPCAVRSRDGNQGSGAAPRRMPRR
jgi:hypothetical protein